MLNIFHLIILAAAIFVTAAVFRRAKAARDLCGRYAPPLLIWGFALVLTTIFFFFVALWGYKPESVFASDARLISPWLIVTILGLLILSAYKIIDQFRLFRPLFSVLLIYLAAILLQGRYDDALAQSRSYFDVLNDALPFAVLAPLQFYAGFLFLFIGFTTLGRHFWRWRFLGYLLIAFSLLMLGVLNIGSWGLPQVIAPWDVGRSAPGGLASFLQRCRESQYLFFLAGFYLATLPRQRQYKESRESAHVS